MLDYANAMAELEAEKARSSGHQVHAIELELRALRSAAAIAQARHALPAAAAGVGALVQSAREPLEQLAGVANQVGQLVDGLLSPRRR